jgi:hypothetical protein
MSSKNEIKNAFEAELKNTPQYQIVINIKNLIMQEIATPNIQSSVIYNFEIPQNDEERNIIKMCMIIEFGFSTDNMNESCCIIEMKKFLE